VRLEFDRGQINDFQLTIASAVAELARMSSELRSVLQHSTD
jgi:hypothetical protein